MPRGRGGRGGSGHSYQGSSHLYVPNTGGRRHSAALTTPWPSEKPVCRFFQRGHCSKGSQCPFPHPGEQEGIHSHRSRPRTGVANPTHGSLPQLEESSDKRATGVPPSPPATHNAGNDVHMCECNRADAELAKLKHHLAMAKHIVEKLCEGNDTLLRQANNMAAEYKLEF